MAEPTKNEIRDFKLYFNEKGDQSFVKKHNDFVIDEVIKKHEVKRRAEIGKAVDAYGERADAVVTYLKALERGGSSSNIEKYFGKSMLAKLRGDEIREQLMSGLSIKSKPARGRALRLNASQE